MFSVCGISTYKQVKFLGKILQHCNGNSFSFLKLSERGVQGGHWIMVYDYGFKKERIRGLNHKQNERFSTLLLPLCSMAAAPLCAMLCVSRTYR